MIGGVQWSGALIGRASEQAILEWALASLDAGDAGLVEVVGEPGIGKTRLLRELATRAVARGFLVLEGRATELEQDLPYGVWIDALDAHLETLDERRLGRLVAGGGSVLAAVFPTLSPSAAVDARVERHEVHRATRALLGRLAEPRPVVLCIDDVHWADPASVDLLAALALRPVAGRILLALAYRAGAAPARLEAAVARACRDLPVDRIDVSGLSATESRALLGPDMEPSRAAELIRSSGGTRSISSSWPASRRRFRRRRHPTLPAVCRRPWRPR
jgi:predicted ATPase